MRTVGGPKYANQIGALGIRAAAAKSCPVSPADRHFTKRSMAPPAVITIQWISFFLRKTLNSRPGKTHGKKRYGKNMKNHVMVCPPLQNQNEVAKPSGSLQYPPPPFFEDFGGHFHVMCAQLRPVGTTNSLANVRRLPTRSAAPVSLDRPPLSPRLSAR